MTNSEGGLSLKSQRIEVQIAPATGGDILSVTERQGSRNVLWQSPWSDRRTASNVAASSEAHWTERSPGGWQLLLPNAGEPCVVDGMEHGFHGEAALIPWESQETDGGVVLSAELYGAPLHVERTLAIEDDTLAVSTRITASGAVATDFVAVEHAAFGDALLDGAVTITTDARTVAVDADYDAPGNRFKPGSHGTWPRVPGADGSAEDLGRPQDRTSGFCFLGDFARGTGAILRDDRSLGIELTWDRATLPAAWLWQELAATSTGPWFGRTRVIGLEPATSAPAAGLAAARDAGTSVHLEPGEGWSTWVRLRVLTDQAEVEARLMQAIAEEGSQS